MEPTEAERELLGERFAWSEDKPDVWWEAPIEGMPYWRQAFHLMKVDGGVVIVEARIFPAADRLLWCRDHYGLPLPQLLAGDLATGQWSNRAAPIEAIGLGGTEIGGRSGGGSTLAAGATGRSARFGERR